MNRIRLIGIASFVVAFVPTVTLTSEGSELKEIMQELRDNLVDISDGLLMDDFEQVARRCHRDCAAPADSTHTGAACGSGTGARDGGVQAARQPRA